MSDTQYTYAVARIRARENSLLNPGAVEQLMTCRDADQCIQMLTERGWGDSDTPADGEALLQREQEKVWELMRELAPDYSIFDVFSLPMLYHNLKAAIKDVCALNDMPHIFYEGVSPSEQDMMAMVRARDFSPLDSHMAEAASRATEELLHTKDGQLCDIIIDKAMLEAVQQAGAACKERVIRTYADTYVAVTDIKIAVRCLKTGKSREFMRQALAPCALLNVEQMADTVLRGGEALNEYLSRSGFASCVQALEQSMSAFECWCDDTMLDALRPEKYHAFSAGPLVAYVLAKLNEIKTVRMILTGKANSLPDDIIRERVRKTYV